MKQWNRLAESNVKKSKSMLTSMLSIAKHLSESFCTKAWELSDLIHSLGWCKIVGKGDITKFQSIRGYAPDLNSIILLPFGQPVEFYIPTTNMVRAQVDHALARQALSGVRTNRTPNYGTLRSYRRSLYTRAH